MVEDDVAAFQPVVRSDHSVSIRPWCGQEHASRSPLCGFKGSFKEVGKIKEKVLATESEYVF